MSSSKNIENRKTLPPSFFVVGAQKAGTTALHYYLSQHPDIFLPEIKETHFFDDGHGDFRLGVDCYIDRYFRTKADCLLAGEVDPEYLFFPEAAPRIAEHFPRSRLIFIFRDPVARAYSHYQMSLSRGRERLEFHKAIAREQVRMDLMPESINPDAERVLYRSQGQNEEEYRRLFNHVARSDFSYVSRGFYFKQVARYLEFFPREQMLFLLADDLRKDATRALRCVYKHLGVTEASAGTLAHELTNPATLPRSARLQKFLLDNSLLKTWLKRLAPPDIRSAVRYRLVSFNARPSKLPTMNADLEAHLRLIYQNDVMKLAELIDRDLCLWLPKKIISGGVGDKKIHD